MTVVSTFFTYRDTDMHFLKEKYAGLLKTCGGPSVIKCNELNVFVSPWTQILQLNSQGLQYNSL